MVRNLEIPRDCQDPLEKRKSLALAGNPTQIPPSSSPLPNHYTGWAIPVHTVKLNEKKINYTPLRYPVICSSHPLLNLQVVPSLHVLPLKLRNHFSTLSTTLIFLEKCKKREALHYATSPASSYLFLLRAKYFLQHTLFLYSSFNKKQKVSYPNKTTVKIVVLHTSIRYYIVIHWIDIQCCGQQGN
jgi:hypothetical protein